jgi:hypothetical protein
MGAATNTEAQHFTYTRMVKKTIELLIICATLVLPLCAQAAPNTFKAGVAAIDVSPQTYPVLANGGFLERSATSLLDPLYARAVALSDGETTIVMCVVDSCMMPQDLIDQAKKAASKITGISTDRMMVSATHTHSAPSAMACLGSRVDPAYAAFLPGKITEAIEGAWKNLQPARVGWASIDDWEHAHNRRWIRRSDKLLVDPYGNPTARAHMHPGFQSKDIIGPSGPSDPGLSILVAQTLDGTPIALLANYAPHYFGTGMISADYYGVFCREIAKQLNQPSSEGPFVAMMSQGTSGDQSSRDYHKEKAPPSMELYGQELAIRALKAYNTIQWHENPPIAIIEKTINLPFRMPAPERLAWARKTLSEMKTELPTGWPEVYSNEAVILHERKNSDLKLQAIRIGSLTITTFPNEVYAITGLKMKQQAPLDQHFNIELANGSVGYIPPPEQHALGGYTTWAARTAGLDIQAEPVIVETLLSALEEITQQKRKPIIETDGPYTKAIKAAKPVAYWRMNEIQGRTAHSAIPDGPSATISGGAALYLPGVATGSGGGEEQKLMPSAFSGPDQLNRAIHFVIDGRMEATIPQLDTQATVAFWFWLGETSGASKRTGTLCTLPSQVALSYDMNELGETTLNLSSGVPSTSAVQAKEKLSLGNWHFAVLEAKKGKVYLYIDGNENADATIPFSGSLKGEPLRFAKGLEGKLDEIAVFDHALTPKERHTFWTLSGVPERLAQAEKKIAHAKEEAAARATPPIFPPQYTQTINDLKPVLKASLKWPHKKLIQESIVNLSEETYAEFNGGRLNGAYEILNTRYSISLWFKN